MKIDLRLGHACVFSLYTPPGTHALPAVVYVSGSREGLAS